MTTPRRFAVILAALGSAFAVALLTGMGPSAGLPAPRAASPTTTPPATLPLADMAPLFPGRGLPLSSELSPGVIGSQPGLAAGHGKTCTVTGEGAAQCWGAGPAGDGTITTQGAPVHVLGVAPSARAVGVGLDHTCIVSLWGAVKCWGNNSWGQLGDGTTLGRVIPVDVAGTSADIQAVALGGAHTCALAADGGVQCWGNNHTGALGDGTTTNRLAPVPVGGLPSGVQALALGMGHSCALTSAGGVLCWGWNQYGQLGDGTTTDRSVPVAVEGLTSGVVAIAAGTQHTCAVTTHGDVACWGGNAWHQLGDGTTTDSPVPIHVYGLTSPAKSVAVGTGHSCVVTTGGEVACWGNNAEGELGDGTTTDRPAPVVVAGLTGVSSVAAGTAHTCVMTSAAAIKCWGSNEYGQVGDGSRQPHRLRPVAVASAASPQPPEWLQVNSEFSDPNDPGPLWIGCDSAFCSKLEDGAYTIERKQQGGTFLWLTPPEVPLQTATLTLDVASLTTKGTPFVGLACMTAVKNGYVTANYEISLSSTGRLWFLKYANSKYTRLRDPVAIEGFKASSPPGLVLSCTLRKDGAQLAVGVQGGELYTALDKKPLKTGAAALLFGNDKKGTSITRIRSIDLIGVLKG